MRIGIIGGGVGGCSIARELAESGFDDIYVFEKNSSIRGENQSSRNSGVIHSGIYYSKNTMPLKAELCVEGNELLYGFCDKYNVPAIKTGKFIVAVDDIDEEMLDVYLERSQENGLYGVTKIPGSTIEKIESNVRALSALYIPSSGIVDPAEFVSRLQGLASSKGVNFLTDMKIVDVKANGNFELTVSQDQNKERFECDVLINCAGLYADEIARMVNPESPYIVKPVRGEWMRFYRKANVHMFGMNVYPTPYYYSTLTGERLNLPREELDNLVKKGEAGLTLGFHLTPTFGLNGNIGDTIIVGPSANPVSDKEDYKSEIPRERFLSEVSRFFPNLKLDDLEEHQVGIRSKLENSGDFVIEHDNNFPGCINLLGIESPGLTSYLAIAKKVRGMLNYAI